METNGVGLSVVLVGHRITEKWKVYKISARVGVVYVNARIAYVLLQKY